MALAASVDALWTTLWVDGGAGPVAERILKMTRRSLRVLFRGHPRHLSFAGPVSITTTLGTWVAMLWAGWSLIFLASGRSVVASSTGVPGDVSDHVYFTAYTLFTVGYGEFVPEGAVWQVLSGVAALNGLGIVTLSLTYVITVLTAVVQQRALANEILGMAARPQDLVLKAWNRGRFEGIDQLLGNLSSRLSEAAERRLAYPILHAYQSADREKAMSVALAVLDEALTIFRFGIQEQARPAALPLHSARAAIGSYFQTLPEQDVKEADEAPPPPTLLPLRSAGIPVVDEASFRGSLDGLAERRRLLLGNLRMDDREWPDASDRSNPQEEQDPGR